MPTAATQTHALHARAVTPWRRCRWAAGPPPWGGGRAGARQAPWRRWRICRSNASMSRCGVPEPVRCCQAQKPSLGTACSVSECRRARVAAALTNRQGGQALQILLAVAQHLERGPPALTPCTCSRASDGTAATGRLTRTQPMMVVLSLALTQGLKLLLAFWALRKPVRTARSESAYTVRWIGQEEEDSGARPDPAAPQRQPCAAACAAAPADAQMKVLPGGEQGAAGAWTRLQATHR